MIDTEIPGTAQIRRITANLDSKELLETAAALAAGGYDKKLFSVLSRVYTEKKGFGYAQEEGMKEQVETILSAEIPPELKMQTFTSFELPFSLRPGTDVVKTWLENCAPNRLNIAAFFLGTYGYGGECFKEITGNRELYSHFVSTCDADALLTLYEAVLDEGRRENITGVTRSIKNFRRHFEYSDKTKIRAVTERVFSSRDVFYTTKLMYCLAFCVPQELLLHGRDLYKMLKIAINYEEKTTKEFVKRYHLNFDCSDEAMCKYFLNNKKAEDQRALVEKFAAHLVLIPEEGERRFLLRTAFKRGGMFRMYAGCMQDGYVNEDKQRHFRYTEEEIAWVKTLPGLKKEKS